MASTAPPSATASTAASTTDPAARKEDAAEVLRMVFGAEVVTALHEGFAKGGDFTAVVPLLVGPGAKPYLAAATRAALATACDTGQAGVAALLLESDGVRGEDANVASTHVDGSGENGLSLLAAAADRGDLGVVGVLVSSGKADVNAGGTGGHAPLARAAMNGHVACLGALLAADGIDANLTDEHGDTALIDATAGGNVACLQALLAVDGIQVNHAGDSGYTATMYAAENGHAECLHALLAADGIDANPTSNYGQTALIMASIEGHDECVRALLAVDGINVNHATDGGNTALNFACCNNETKCVRALATAKGIDLGHHDPFFGHAPLHNACDHSNAEMASLLLVAGGCRFALEDAPAETRRTPLELAKDTKEGRAVRAVFLSGVDYWQRRLHGGHSWAMRKAVMALMLTRQRLDAGPPVRAAVAVRASRRGAAAPISAPRARPLVHLPEEIWLLVCGFLRSADYPPC